MISGETSGSLIGKCGCKGRPLKEKMNGRNAGDFDGDIVCEECPLKGKTAGADKQGEMGEKVAEIEFFEVENHAENGHLSPDKWTKSSDKVFVLFQTFT